jgi:hypothetical protein
MPPPPTASEQSRQIDARVEEVPPESASTGPAGRAAGDAPEVQEFRTTSEVFDHA